MSATIARPRISATPLVSVTQVIQALPPAFVCLGIAAFGVFEAWIRPTTARMWYDPSLQYLFASLSWFRGAAYAYVDHPGTPLELLGTLLLGLSYPVLHQANEGFVSHYLRHPQQFLSMAQTLAVGASGIAAVLLARRSVAVTNFSQAVIGGAMAALFFVVLSDGFQMLQLWGYQSFVFSAGTLLSLALLIAVRRAGGPSWGTVLGLGLASGVLSSLHLYFAAWVVGTAVALGIAVWLRGGSWVRAMWCALAVVLMAGLGFAVATLPIHDHYGQFLNWIWWITSHQGTYGQGASGVPGADQLFSTLVALASRNQSLFVACGVGIGLLSWQLWRTRHRQSAHPAVWAAGLGLTAQLLILLLLNARHPGLGGAIGRYLPQVAATLPLLFAAALDNLDVWPRRAQQLLAVLALIVLGYFGVGVRSAIAAQAVSVDWLRIMDARTEEMLVRLSAEQHVPRESLRTLWTFGTTSPCYALWLGDDASERTFHKDVAEICPRDRELVLWTASVSTNDGYVNMADYHDWDVVVMGDGFLADVFPDARPAGVAHPSSIETWGYGKLLFITPH